MNPRNRYKAIKYFIVPHQCSSVVNSNSVNPQNDSWTYAAAGSLSSHKIIRENSPADRTSLMKSYGNKSTSDSKKLAAVPTKRVPAASIPPAHCES